MELIRLPFELTVCQVSSLPPELLEEELLFLGKTEEELSLVCRRECVPAETINREDGWRAFRIGGVLDFSLTGILSPIAALLAEARIGIFALSTYNTDYILVKEESLDRAAAILAGAGYTIR